MRDNGKRHELHSTSQTSANPPLAFGQSFREHSEGVGPSWMSARHKKFQEISFRPENGPVSCIEYIGGYKKKTHVASPRPTTENRIESDRKTGTRDQRRKPNDSELDRRTSKETWCLERRDECRSSHRNSDTFTRWARELSPHDAHPFIPRSAFRIQR